MRPYGIPRVFEIDFPDVADIRRFGFASHVGSLRGRSGDFRSCCRGASKARIRRIWKRLERIRAVLEIRRELIEYMDGRRTV